MSETPRYPTQSSPGANDDGYYSDDFEDVDDSESRQASPNKKPSNLRQTGRFAIAASPTAPDESPWAESPPPSRTPGPARGGGLATPMGHQWRGWQGPGGQRGVSRMGSACPTERPESVYYDDDLMNRPYTGLECATPGTANPMEEVSPSLGRSPHAIIVRMMEGLPDSTDEN
eukprot:1180450-Prorocentrum_minimum.AAC.2